MSKRVSVTCTAEAARLTNPRWSDLEIRGRTLGVVDKTGRTRGGSLRVIADLNPLLKGWFGYFQRQGKARALTDPSGLVL